MKKLLSFFAAGLLAVGSLSVMSCSGDLQDNDVQPLYVVGSGFEGATWDLDKPDVKAAQATLVEADGSVQKFELKATASKAEVKFATARSWSNDIAGSDTKELFPIINGDSISLYSREANGLPNTKNVVINDLTVGETYIIDINFNPISFATSIKVSGNAVVMPALTLAITGDSKNFPAKDEAGNELTYTMDRAGTEYTYQFISKADETISFHLESSTASLTYGGASSFPAEGSLTAYSTAGMSIECKKDYEYKVTVKMKSITDVTIKGEVVPLLKNAAVNADWLYDGVYWEKDATTDNANDGAASIVFQYGQSAQKNVDFTVNRIKGSNTLAWGGASIAPGDDFAELTYSSEGKAEKVTFNNLTENNFYLLQVKNESNDFKLSTRVLDAPVEETVYLIGGFGNSPIFKADGTTKTDESDINWGTPAHKVELTDGKATVIYTYTSDGWGGQNGEQNFKFLNNLEDKLEYCGGSFEAGNEASLILAGNGNALMKKLKSGTKYKIHITSIPAYLKVTFEEVK